MAVNASSLLISSLLIFLFIVEPTLSDKQGFTANLIHRDSPLSPLNTESLDQYERLRNAIKRSMSRINRFSTSATGDVHSQVKASQAQGEYIMEWSIGTPPVSQFGVVDTGSDLTWTQCQPCIKCFNQTLPIFDPSKSTTYESKSCDSQACKALYKSQYICSRNNTCGYSYNYGDRSQSIGSVASETLTFKSGDNEKSISFSNINFGCSHLTSGSYTKDASGIVGLGGGPLSLVSQLNSSINGKFSYCLIPLSKQDTHTSKINFGTNGIVSGPGVISTPIVKGQRNTFYYLTLEGFTVGKTKISFFKRLFITNDDNNTTSKKGNIIIDSGTILTILPSEIYNDLKSALEGAIEGEKVKDPMGYLDLCYKTRYGGGDLNIPNVVAHFDGGDLELKPFNIFMNVSDEVLCLSIVPLHGQTFGILGYLAQMNVLVGYDTVEGKVSFKRTDCTVDKN